MTAELYLLLAIGVPLLIIALVFCTLWLDRDE
jgi:hypothetical protein